MRYLELFFAGLFLCNSIPHLVAGLQGRPFPTPFRRFQGVERSSPLVNVLWAAFNLCVGFSLLARHPWALGANPSCLALGAGGLVLGLYLSLHFGKMESQH